MIEFTLSKETFQAADIMSRVWNNSRGNQFLSHFSRRASYHSEECIWRFFFVISLDMPYNTRGTVTRDPIMQGIPSLFWNIMLAPTGRRLVFPNYCQVFFRHFLQLQPLSNINHLLDFITENPPIGHQSHEERHRHAFLLEILEGSKTCNLASYGPIFQQYYDDRITATQIQQVCSDLPKMFSTILQWCTTANFPRRIDKPLCVKQIYMECFAHDMFACIRLMRQGRPLFMHFFEHQQLYISASIPQNEILQAMRQGSCMRTANQIQIQEHDIDPFTQLNAMLTQHNAANNDLNLHRNLQTSGIVDSTSAVINQRHLLAVLPDTRHKIPKH